MNLWLFYVIMVIVMWSGCSLLYKAGIHREKEDHTPLKYQSPLGSFFYHCPPIFDNPE